VGRLPSGRGAAGRGGGGYRATAPAELIAAAKAFDSTLAQVGGNPEGGRGFGGGGRGRPAPSFFGVNEDFAGQINTLENGDMAPTEAMQRAYVAGCTDLKQAVTAWTALAAPLASFNAVLTQHHLKPTAGTVPALVGQGCSGS
jgi:hypothetical protein